MPILSRLIPIITSADPAVRNQSLDGVCQHASVAELLHECEQLDQFRRQNTNLYERVRALFFLYAIHRFHLPAAFAREKTPSAKAQHTVQIPYSGYQHLLSRRFDEAIDLFLAAQSTNGSNPAISSALASAYHRLAFRTLADQVRHSVRTVRGNQWMFRMGHPADQPLRLRAELHNTAPNTPAPILRECTPVRMDLSHSGWSDIFFLGMDYPEGARVINISIDLSVRKAGQDAKPRPPVEAYLRVISEPILRLTSVDLDTTADITSLSEVFDFARDYLGLLKAAVIASGIVPPGLEGSDGNLAELLTRVVGPGMGLELVSQVNDIPKGSRLAVSTNLLACLISVCMRATGQTQSLTGQLTEDERRLVAARAILGEWIAGSGGGWQDSGGVWPGAKLIEGAFATPDDPEFGISRGRLLPRHTLLNAQAPQPTARSNQPTLAEHLQNSLVLVHGGMAQNVGPILEMVTEKYLLRSEAEWVARQQAGAVLNEILALLQNPATPELPRALGNATTHNFFGPLQTIIPWASNAFTERIIARAKAAFGADFWGFWMLGGMSGGGMGFIVSPTQHAHAKDELLRIMQETKREMQHALPFAMEPVVYDFAINERGTYAELLSDTIGAGPKPALMPHRYYALTVPALVKQNRDQLSSARRAELDQFAQACQSDPAFSGAIQAVFDRLVPRASHSTNPNTNAPTLHQLLQEYGFDRVQHEHIREDLRAGRIGLAQNRLPARSHIEDVQPGDVADATLGLNGELAEIGRKAIQNGEVAVVTLAAGAGSRWTQGAGVVKALHPFCKLGGRHRSFIEVHLAKTQKVAAQMNAIIPHIFTTSYATHAPIKAALGLDEQSTEIYLSPGRSVGLRMVPMTRDLRFAYEEVPQQLLDEQAQKMRTSLHAALIHWAQSSGEANDYTDNVPQQCLHPVGHWPEVPNMLRNGVLLRLLNDHPNLKYLMLHNIDTVGANVDAALLGWHIANHKTLTFEVIERLIEDRGGGLARVDGQLRIVESLAMPREEDEFKLSYYNSMTTWISIDGLLNTFGLARTDLSNSAHVDEAVRALAQRMPTYITLKDVKKRWGHGQEDILPVAQWEKLWSDMSALPDLACGFIAVPRVRGQQLKDQAQLDGWLRDGSAKYVEAVSFGP